MYIQDVCKELREVHNKIREIANKIEMSGILKINPQEIILYGYNTQQIKEFIDYAESKDFKPTKIGKINLY